MNQLLQLLIVDDEAFMRENLSSLFPWHTLGYQIAALCSNGQEALDYIQSHPVDVILTDIQLPGMDGLQLVKQIRLQRIPVEVVFLSAYSNFEYVQQGIIYGAVDYLIKPVSYQELTNLFSRLYEKLTHQKETAGPTGLKEISPDESALSKITDYIRTRSSVSLDDCASFTGFTISYISSLLKVRCSMTFTEYVYQQKMIFAGELLHEINLPISSIADTLGYSNAKNFSRAFHNYYHMTPMQYRKLEKQ